MYANILIPTDGSELAGKAVQHGLALAKRIGAKATVLTVLPPFHTLTTDTQMIEDTLPQYKARMQKHAEKTLGAVAQAARAAGVLCETDGHQLVVAEIIDVTCEALYGVTCAAQAKPKLAALVQIIVGVRLHRGQGRAHVAHPGQGSATAARFLLSSLA